MSHLTKDSSVWTCDTFNRMVRTIWIEFFIHCRITLEDIVEEIFGELRDEYDESEEDTFKELPDGSYMVSASLKLDDLDDLLDVDLDSEDYDSLGGYIIELLDHLPSEGETAEDEHFLFKVVSVDKNRMETIHIIPKEQ